jgi:hypothetical protein
MYPAKVDSRIILFPYEFQANQFVYTLNLDFI